MFRTWIPWFAAGAVGVAGLVGCAEGADADYSEGLLTNLPVSADDDDAGSVVMPPPSSKPSDDDDDADAGGGGGGGGGGGADSGTKDAGADSGGGGGGGGGGTGTCASPNTCAASTDLGSISGDTGSGVKTASGSTSQWFKILVTEDDSTPFGLSLLAKATLTSPPGTNFDLYVYLGSGSAPSCSGVTKSSTTTGTDTAPLEFGETGLISNGSDDSRYLTIEVRHVSGTCAPGTKWTLNVAGNTF